MGLGEGDESRDEEDEEGGLVAVVEVGVEAVDAARLLGVRLASDDAVAAEADDDDGIERLFAVGVEVRRDVGGREAHMTKARANEGREGMREKQKAGRSEGGYRWARHRSL